MGMSESGLAASQEKMRAAGANPTAIAVFSKYYHQLEEGVTGIIPEDSISPLLDPVLYAELDVPEDVQREALDHTAVIKLNGGLGTSMGLDKAKNLLDVHPGLTFLDIIAGQILHARKKYGVKLPLFFMDSQRTQADSLAFLDKYPDLKLDGLPLDFLQNYEPKLRVDDLTPVEYPEDPSLEWCPPGHGDLYAALWENSLIEKLLDLDYRYLFVSNGDNLGATLDPKLAGWFASGGFPYASEVCTRTPNDRKGGHLAIRKADGRLILRDSAQTSDEDQKYFQDEHRHPYFHANNLWFNLEALYSALKEHDGVLDLPLIRNEKTVNPADSSTTPVYQMETAMGTAVELFDGAQAIAVPRSRFLPVKTTNELLLLRSDVYELGEDFIFRQAAEKIPEIDLDKRYYKLIHEFEKRVKVPPSLRLADVLAAKGDWTFDGPGEVVGTLTLPETNKPQRFPEDLSIALNAQGMSVAQYLAALDTARKQAEVSPRVLPSSRTELNADERRLMQDVPPHW
jgi:UTP--glucose-1-phosphate uridylyltransferase